MLDPEITIVSINPGDIFHDVKLKYKHHVVAILDEPEKQVVHKYYGKHKQYWHYEIESMYMFQSRLQIGMYKLQKRKEKMKEANSPPNFNKPDPPPIPPIKRKESTTMLLLTLEDKITKATDKLKEEWDQGKQSLAYFQKGKIEAYKEAIELVKGILS